MGVQDWFSVIVNGLLLGMNYALVASGLTLIFGVMRIFNFAHGEFYMLGLFAAYYLFQVLGLNFLATVLISMLSVGFIGFIIERFLFRPFRGQMLPAFIISLGLAVLFPGIAMVAFGGQEKTVQTAFTGIVSFFGISISIERLVVFAVSLALLVGLALFISRTKMGMAMRAVAQDSEVAALQGINVNRICSIGFVLACALAAGSGTLLAPMRYVGHSVGGEIVIDAAMIVILGGLGSFPGAIVGALLLGLAHSVGGAFIGSLAHLFGFVMVIFILLFRPIGLLGHEKA